MRFNFTFSTQQMEYRIVNNGTTAELLFYGRIGSWYLGAEDYLLTLQKIEAAGIKNVNIRVHSVGGEVFEGAAIWTANKSSKLKIDFYVDGVAASMMAIVLLSGSNVYVSSMAKVMVHAPSVGAGGTSKQMFEYAKLLKKIEADFVNVWKTKTNQTEAQAKAYMDGADYWFNADDCVNIGLATAITEETKFTTETMGVPDKGTKAETIFNQYTAVAAVEFHHQNNNEMTKEQKGKVIADLGLKNVTADSSDAEVLEAINKHNTAQATALQNAAQSSEQMVVNTATALITAKETERGTPFTKEQKDAYIAIAKAAGIDVLTQSLSAVQAGVNLEQLMSGAGGDVKKQVAAERANWDFDKWAKEDPAGLTEMETTNLPAFKKLYEAKYPNNEAIFK